MSHNNPENYHNLNSQQVSVTKLFLESAKEEFSKKNFGNAKLIDIGTGDGRVLVELFIKSSGVNFSHVIGTDKREDVIKFAHDFYASELISFEVLDIENGKEEDFEKLIKNGQFDLATSFFALQYAVDHKIVFSNINKLLKLGGSFYFNFICTSSIIDIFEELTGIYPELKETLKSQVPMTAGSESYKEKLPKLLRESGFEIDFLNYETNSFDFESEQLFRGN
jgi:SAM-dependent methyltransferase